MATRLSMMTWDEVQSEMSIAGEPGSARKFGEEVLALSARSMDKNNIPSVDNQIFSLERVIAELKLWKKTLEERQRIM